MKANDWGISKARALAGFGGRVAGAATFGSAATIMRGTAGRYGTYLADKDGLKDAASQSGLRGWAARRGLNASTAASTASFEARQVSGLGKKIGVGEGQKGGYEGMLKATAKRDAEYGEKLGLVDDEDFYVQQRIEEKKIIEKQIKTLRVEHDQAKTPQEKGAKTKAIQDAEEVLKQAEQKIEQEKRRRILGSTFNREIETIEADLKASKELVSEAWKKYLDAKKAGDKSRMKLYKAQVESEQKQTADLKKEIDQARAQSGYIGVISASDLYGKMTSWLSGRSWRQSNYSADELRKKYEKAVKRSKEDKQTDSVVDAINKSKDTK